MYSYLAPKLAVLFVVTNHLFFILTATFTSPPTPPPHRMENHLLLFIRIHTILAPLPAGTGRHAVFAAHHYHKNIHHLFLGTFLPPHKNAPFLG